MTAAQEPVVACRDAQFEWPGRGGEPGFSLSVADWRVAPGDRICVVGPSGAGKTTLINLICAVAPPRAGVVRIMGEDVGLLSGPARDRLRARHIGLVFQMFNLLPYASVLENVLLPLSFSPERRAAAGEDPAERAAALLDRLRLDPAQVLERPVAALSAGQQQRVAAARALIGAPALIVADEPTSALDAAARDDFLDLLFAEAGAAGSAVVVVSHDERVAARFSEVVQLSDIAAGRRAAV